MVEHLRASLPLKISLAWLFFSSICVLFSQQSFAQEPATIDPTEYRHFCGKVFIGKGEKLDLKEMERRLICGDPKGDQIGIAWANIPANQASFFLNSFLQSRAYHRPQLNIIAGNLYVRLGPKSRAGAFTLKDEPPDWRIPNRRYVRGRLLEPSLLDELAGWGEYQLKMNGYACGEASALSDPLSGEIEVRLLPKDRLRIMQVIDESATGLNGGVMERYNAFVMGDFYNQRMVDLTQRRISEEGVVSTIDFKPRCEKDGVVLLRRIDPVRPGLNTDSLFEEHFYEVIFEVDAYKETQFLETFNSQLENVKDLEAQALGETQADTLNFENFFECRTEILREEYERGWRDNFEGLYAN